MGDIYAILSAKSCFAQTKSVPLKRMDKSREKRPL
jgi:hypothetical protein